MMLNIQTLEFIGRKLRPVELRLLVKRALNLKRQTLSLADGRSYNIDPISDLGLRLMKDKSYEHDMTRLIEQTLREGDCFIDLGANEGYFTVLGSKLCGPTGKVFAIEPQRRLWPIIYDNLFINGINNVQLLPYGIGSKNAEINLQLYPSTNSGATSFSGSFNFKMSFGNLRKKLYGTQIAKVTTLDALASVFPAHVKLIKIDIEGYELEALKGAERLIKAGTFMFLLIEIHPEALRGMNQSAEAIDDFLAGYQYTKTVIAADLFLYGRQ